MREAGVFSFDFDLFRQAAETFADSSPSKVRTFRYLRQPNLRIFQLLAPTSRAEKPFERARKIIETPIKFRFAVQFRL